MARTKGTIEVFCSPENLMKVITDYGSYHEFIPEVQRASVIREDGDNTDVRYEISVAFAGFKVESEYTVRYTKKGLDVEWVLLSSPDITTNEGAWRLREVDEDETVAHYEAEIVTSLPIPAEVQNLFAEQEMPVMLERFRDRAEELFG